MSLVLAGEGRRLSSAESLYGVFQPLLSLLSSTKGERMPSEYKTYYPSAPDRGAAWPKVAKEVEQKAYQFAKDVATELEKRDFDVRDPYVVVPKQMHDKWSVRFGIRGVNLVVTVNGHDHTLDVLLWIDGHHRPFKTLKGGSKSADVASLIDVYYPQAA